MYITPEQKTKLHEHYRDIKHIRNPRCSIELLKDIKITVDVLPKDLMNIVEAYAQVVKVITFSSLIYNYDGDIVVVSQINLKYKFNFMITCDLDKMQQILFLQMDKNILKVIQRSNPYKLPYNLFDDEFILPYDKINEYWKVWNDGLFFGLYIILCTLSQDENKYLQHKTIKYFNRCS